MRSGVDSNTFGAWLGHVSLDATHIYAEVELGKRKLLALCDLPSYAGTRAGHPAPKLMEFLRTLRQRRTQKLCCQPRAFQRIAKLGGCVAQRHVVIQPELKRLAVGVTHLDFINVFGPRAFVGIERDFVVGLS
jgi:hypothetical protein